MRVAAVEWSQQNLVGDFRPNGADTSAVGRTLLSWFRSMAPVTSKSRLLSAASSGLLFGTAGSAPTPVPRPLPPEHLSPALRPLLTAIERAARTRPRAGLAIEGLAVLSPRQWAALRLNLQPGLGIVRVPAVAFEQWVAGDGRSARSTAVRRVSVLVAKSDGRVFVRPLPPGAPVLLRRLRRGEPLGRALAGLPANAPVGSWFAEWRAVGLFAAEL